MRKKFLKISAFSGLVSLLVSIPLVLLEIESGFYFQKITIVLLIGVSIVSYILLMAGFIYLGRILKNRLLVISSYFLILISILSDGILYLAQINSTWAIIYDKPIVTVLFGLTVGLAFFFHGYSLTTFKNYLAKIAKQTGWIEMILGLSAFTIVLSPVSILLTIPMYIYQMKLLWKS